MAAGEGWESSSREDGRRRRAVCDDAMEKTCKMMSNVARFCFFGFGRACRVCVLSHLKSGVNAAAAVFVLREVCVRASGAPSSPLFTLLLLLR